VPAAARLPRSSAVHLGIRASRSPSLGVAPSRGSTHAEEPRSPRCLPGSAPERAPAVRPRPCPRCPAVLAAARAASPRYPCSRVAYKEPLPLGHDAQAAPPQPSRPQAPSRAAVASSNSGRPRAQGGPSSTSPAPTIARRPVHQTNRAAPRRNRQPRWPPPLAAGVPALPAAPCPNQARNPPPSNP
jgi:hypothetical protein